jgi:ankyrin repeat protein
LLYQAICYSANDFTSVSYLIDNGADLLQQTRSTGSVLHVAAQNGYTWLTERLLQLIPMEKIAEMLDFPSEYHGTVLYAASGQGHVRVVEVLLDAGASINAWSTVCSNTSGTALMIACINGHEDVVRLLLSRGARMTVFNSDGLEGSALKVTRARCARTLRILQEWDAATTDRCSYFGY